MNRNNTTTPIVAILMIATLVVGATFAATTIATPQSAFAGGKKVKQDTYTKKAPPQREDNNKTRDNNGNDNGGSGGNGNGNGNTVTALKCQNRGSASGFDTTVNQECENLICTHPGENAACTQEGAAAVTPVTPPEEVGCPSGTLYNVRLLQDLPDMTVIPTGTILCLVKNLGDQTATISSQTPVDEVTTLEVEVAQPNQTACNNSGGSWFVLARVESGNPGNPIVFGGTVCVNNNEHQA
jgi:hypothetical protein